MSVVNEKVIKNFLIEGEIVSCEPMGMGHINKTFLLVTDRRKYTFQRINNEVFTDVEGMMRNIDAVTRHISKKRPSVMPIRTKENKLYVYDGEHYYRMMNFFDGIVKERAESAEDTFIAGQGFGQFQADLSDFDGKLNETIKNFHDTTTRYSAFCSVLKSGKALPERLKYAEKMIEKYLSRKNYCDILISPLKSGRVPVRVTHNDTKINNLVLDKKTGEALCVIDLDTVMQGTLLFDFGDAIRMASSYSAEDERDICKIRFETELFEGFLKGFSEKLGKNITENEIKLLADSAKVMTYECGMRFLADYLSGDVYFRDVRYPEHNFVRAASQMALLEDMERKFDIMEKIVYDFFKK